MYQETEGASLFKIKVLRFPRRTSPQTAPLTSQWRTGVLARPQRLRHQKVSWVLNPDNSPIGTSQKARNSFVYNILVYFPLESIFCE